MFNMIIIKNKDMVDRLKIALDINICSENPWNNLVFLSLNIPQFTDNVNKLQTVNF